MAIRNTAKNIFSNLTPFLFKNLGVRQTIVKNTLWLAIAEGISRFLRLILIIYVARILGATEYGKFTFAFAFVSLFVIFSDFGLTQIITREFAREREREREFLSVFSLKIILSLGTLILILVGSFFITPNATVQKIIWILGIYILSNSFSEGFYAFLRARQKMEYEALVKILQALAVGGIGFFIILNFPSIVNLSYSYLFAGFIALIFILIFFHFKVFSLKISFEKSIWQKFLAMSWPIGFIVVFTAIYNSIDSVMMGYWSQITQTGWYNAAYRIIGVTLIPMSLISQSFSPALSIAFKESRERLQNVWNYQMKIMIALAVPLVIGGIVLAPRIIDFIYDPSFLPSILAFQILIITAGMIYLNTTFIQTLIISNQQQKSFWVAFSGAAVNIILNMILIPKYSLYGAAFATLITFFLMLVLYFISTMKFTSINPFNSEVFLIFLGSVLAGILMYFIISQPVIYNINIFLSILIGGAVYSISFFTYRKLVSRFSTN